MYSDVELTFKTENSYKYIAKGFNSVEYEKGKGVTLGKDLFVSDDKIMQLRINGNEFISYDDSF
ncbi:MAG: hypothetical protein IJK60_05670 [Clostridia bacterium]|nr:hypothetical protein [Clostridia bacterium]